MRSISRTFPAMLIATARKTQFCVNSQILVGLILFASFILPQNSIVSLLVALIVLLVPGYALLLTMGLERLRVFPKAFLSLMLSILIIEVGFGLLSTVMFKFGFHSMLSKIPIEIVESALIFLSFRKISKSKPNFLNVVIPTKAPVIDAKFFVFLSPLALPILSFIVVSELNIGKFEYLSRAFTYACVLLYISLVVVQPKHEHFKSEAFKIFLFFNINLAVLFQTALRGNPGFWGFDINNEYSVAQAVIHHQYWLPPGQRSEYAAMLSLTVLPAVLATLLKFSIALIFKIFFPLVAALFPILIYSLLKEFVNRQIAYFVTLLLLIGSITYISQLTALCRQVIGLAFFAGMIFALFTQTIDKKRKYLLFFLMCSGLSCSHYSSAYLAVAIFLFSGMITVSFAGSQSTRKVRFLSFSVAIGALALVTLYNGVITHSLQDTKAQYSQFQKLGGQLLPSKQESFVNRWLNGVKNVQDALPADFKTQVVGADLTQYPNLSTPLTGLAANVSPAKFSSSKLELGRIGGLVFVWSYIIVNVLTQGLIVVTLLFFILWSRLKFFNRRLRQSGSFQPSVNSLYSDVTPILIVSLAFAVLLRISGTLGAFYNPERAAFQLAMLFSLPVALFLQFSLTMFRPLRKFLTIFAGVALFIVLQNQSGLSTFFTGDATSRLSTDFGDSYPYVVTPADRDASQYIGAKADDKTPINADYHGSLMITGNFAINPTWSFGQIAPFGLFQKSYVFIDSSNLVTGVAEGTNLKTTRGLFDFSVPFDYYDKNLNLVYSSEGALVYH